MPPSLENDPIIILNRFPAGAEPGSCLHAILETVDFMPLSGASPTTDQLAEDVAKICKRMVSARHATVRR